MSDDVIVIGAGGFGREVIDVIEAINGAATTPTWNVLGIVDDAPTDENLQRLKLRSIDYLGTVDTVIQSEVRPCYAIGIGGTRVRRAIAKRLDDAGFNAATLVHPTASFGSRVRVGPGSIICAGVRITTNITIGQHVHLNLNATVGHDSELGDFVSVNPLASISGDCHVEDDVLVGVSASLINGVSVGSGATVGGGACVVRSVPTDTAVVGVPAKPLSKKRSA